MGPSIRTVYTSNRAKGGGDLIHLCPLPLGTITGCIIRVSVEETVLNPACRVRIPLTIITVYISGQADHHCIYLYLISWLTPDTSPFI